VSTARLIDQAYVKTGQVRIVSKNLPVHGEQAEQAAEAALCAADQGKYWEYHDKLMESLYVGNRGTVAQDSLKKLAADLGLNTATFMSCLDGGKYTQRVKDEAAEARKLGVTGTPTFFVNDAKLVGAQPFEAFKTAIENALRGP
jgi:protein-disulfide isomerase